MFGSSRKHLIVNLILSLCGVFVAAISTFAWFQIDSQAPEATISTKDPNMEINNENVTGYKVTHSIGADGFVDKTSTTVTSKKGQTYDTSNNNQAVANTDFDVPTEGLGYYLIKKNPGDTYKYQYNGSSTGWSWKFKELNNGGINYMTVSSSDLGTLAGTESFIIREYSYNQSTYKTVNSKIDVTAGRGSFSINTTTYEIYDITAGTYNIWFNKYTKAVSFEEKLDISNKNLAPALGAKRRPHQSISTQTAGSNKIYFTMHSDWTEANASIWLWAWGGDCGGGAWISTSQVSPQIRYNDRIIYQSDNTNSFTDFQLVRGTGDHVRWNNSNNVVYSTSYDFCEFPGKNNGSYGVDPTKSDYDSIRYDGWILIGHSGTGSTTFGDPSANGGEGFLVADAHRLSSSTSGNLGQITITLNPGDEFKVAYLKAGSAGEWEGANKLELYYNGGTTTDFTYVGLFFQNMTSGANCAVNTDIDSFTCTIYFTNGKKINVNPTSSVIVKASKFDFKGDFEEVDSADAYDYEVTFGSSVSFATINALNLDLPDNYSRVGTTIYSDEECEDAMSDPFIANENPMTVYIKVQEDSITITLHAYLTDLLSDTTGGYEYTSTNVMTLSTQFGKNSTVTATDLYTYWNLGTDGVSGGVAGISDTITYNNANYTYARIDNDDHDGEYPDTSGSDADGTTIYVRYVRDTHTITLAPSYFAPNGTSRLSFDIQSTKSETILDYNYFSTSKTFDNCEYKDHSNGIWYVFHRVDANWYSDPSCGEGYIVGNTHRPTSAETVYAKMVAYPVRTFYIDTSYTNWTSTYIHLMGTLSGLSSSMSTSGAACALTTACVAGSYGGNGTLYRVSLPYTDITKFLAFNGYTDGVNQTVDISETTVDNGYLYLTTDYSNPHPASFVSYKSTSSSGTWVQKYVDDGVSGITDDDWQNVENGQLLYGDGTGNDYILESGLRLAHGDIIRVHTSGGTNYGYLDYFGSNIDRHPYVATALSGDGIELVNFTGNARFNFYITHSGKISMAMVPDFGNGYYIMDYNTDIYDPTFVATELAKGDPDLSVFTDHYVGAVKMDSNDYSAIYSGYYAVGGSQIFIKSYLDGVDLLANSLTTASSSYATMEDGILTFTHTGRYTIQVTNRTVDITEYQVSDFFKLNSIDPSSVTGTAAEKKTAIYNQKTSLILEVPFICDNPYASTITLLTDCSVDYIGVNLWVTNAPIATGDSAPSTIYDTLRGQSSPSTFYSGLTAANTTTPITNKNTLFTSIPANNSRAVYYAYILIDYIPSANLTTANIASTPDSFKLYLMSNQVR